MTIQILEYFPLRLIHLNVFFFNLYHENNLQVSFCAFKISYNKEIYNILLKSYFCWVNFRPRYFEQCQMCLISACQTLLYHGLLYIFS